MAGGNSGGVESYLPIAAALAATIATDGAASPWLVEAMGSEAAAGAVMGMGAGALGGGITAAVTGQDVGRNALMGGISGATLGYGMAPAGAVESTTVAAPLTGANVAGNAAIPAGGGAFVPAAGSGASFALPEGAGITANAMTPSMVNFANSTTDPIGAMNYLANASPAEIQAATGPGAQAAAANTAGSTVGNWLSNNKGIAALGGTALLGALIQSDNKRFGTPSTQPYSGPLSEFHYDPKKYTPLTTPQPSPAYRAQYANYVRNPYNAYAAEGGEVKAMANGGIAMANPSIGPVEQMSRDNATGNNQMFPQAAINSPSFSSATNTPMATNMVAPTSDTSVNPYSGAERFAEGGTTETQAPQAPQAIPLQAMPNAITQASVGYNNNLMQNLMNNLATNPRVQQAAIQQNIPMQPAGILGANYGAPTFTRPTNVAPVALNPTWIQGTPAQQAKAAADAEAQRLRDLEYQASLARSNTDTGGGGTGAAGGLMPDNLKYAHGGIAQSSLGGYSDGGRLLKGPGDGMSDNIPASIGGKQPARLADGEFVVPADVVSHLGNGSTDAGAKHLYNMMDKVRKARTGTKKQGKQIKADKYLKA